MCFLLGCELSAFEEVNAAEIVCNLETQDIQWWVGGKVFKIHKCPHPKLRQNLPPKKVLGRRKCHVIHKAKTLNKWLVGAFGVIPNRESVI
jgi:hypothetical protein